ncbi:MAG: BACON domain-containing protein [Propionibacteriaceae bacterium]|nr:BACON domain-containing protein [Propionibacteriaceae bacterium]
MAGSPQSVWAEGTPPIRADESGAHAALTPCRDTTADPATLPPDQLCRDVEWRYVDYGRWMADGSYALNPEPLRASGSEKFIASVRFSRQELPVGSVIEVDKGYAVVISGWASKPANYGNGWKPGQNSAGGWQYKGGRIEVDAARWGAFEYLAFDVCWNDTADGWCGPMISLEDTASHLRIRVPSTAPVHPIPENKAIIKGFQPLNVFTTQDDLGFDIILQRTATVDTPVSWTLTNPYLKKVVATGTTEIKKGTLKTSVNRGRVGETGYYTIEARVGTETITDNIAVVNSNPKLDDSPFGVAGFYSWYDFEATKDNPVTFGTQSTGALADAFARAMRLGGVTWVRDVISWRDVGPVPTGPTGGYEGVIKAYDNYGLHVVENVHVAPTSLLDPRGPSISYDTRLPNELKAAYEFGRVWGEYYNAASKNATVDRWEIWNEQDAWGTDSGDSVDRYSAVMKAMAIGFHESGTHATFGGLTTRYSGHLNSSDPGARADILLIDNYRVPYQDTMFDNGVLEYADMYNFHNHRRNIDPSAETAQTEAWFSSTDHRSFNVAANLAHLAKKESLPASADTPVWLAEAGGAIADAHDGLDGDFDRQMIQARFVITSAVQSLSTGVDKHFFFNPREGVELAPPYDNASYGMFSQYTPLKGQFTPYASYVAEAAMTDALGMAVYRGEVSGLPQGAKGYVFSDRSDTALVLWTDKSKYAVSLNLGKPNATKIDIMGNKTTLTAVSGAVTVDISEDPVFLRFSGEIPTARIKDVAAAHTPIELPLKVQSANEKIVLDQVFPMEYRSGARGSGYGIDSASVMQMSVDVYNLNEKLTVTGTVSGSFDTAGLIVSAPQQTQPITIPPLGKATLTFTLTAATPAAYSGKLTFVGDFNVGKTTPSVSRVHAEPGSLPGLNWVPLTMNGECLPWETHGSYPEDFTVTPTPDGSPCGSWLLDGDRKVHPIPQTKFGMKADGFTNGFPQAEKLRVTTTGVSGKPWPSNTFQVLIGGPQGSWAVNLKKSPESTTNPSSPDEQTMWVADLTTMIPWSGSVGPHVDFTQVRWIYLAWSGWTDDLGIRAAVLKSVELGLDKETYIQVEPSAQWTVEPSGGSKTVVVTCEPEHWVVTSLPSWVSTSAVTGTSGQQLVLTATRNDTDKARSAEVRITAGGKTIEIPVVQGTVSSVSEWVPLKVAGACPQWVVQGQFKQDFSVNPISTGAQCAGAILEGDRKDHNPPNSKFGMEVRFAGGLPEAGLLRVTTSRVPGMPWPSGTFQLVLEANSGGKVTQQAVANLVKVATSPGSPEGQDMWVTDLSHMAFWIADPDWATVNFAAVNRVYLSWSGWTADLGPRAAIVESVELSGLTLGVSDVGPVTFTGQPTVGEVLTASVPEPGPAGAILSWEWRRGDQVVSSGQTGLSSSYTPVPADLGSVLTVRVTAQVPGYMTASLPYQATTSSVQ